MPDHICRRYLGNISGISRRYLGDFTGGDRPEHEVDVVHGGLLGRVRFETVDLSLLCKLRKFM